MKLLFDFDKYTTLDFLEHPILYYDEEYNLFTDDGGYIIFNIFAIISPNILAIFKLYQENMVVRGNSGKDVTLIYGGVI
jgi:hypothetical protein